MMDGLARDDVPFSLGMSLTPPLCEMLEDALLRDRFIRRLDGLLRIMEAFVPTVLGTPWEDAAAFQAKELQETRDLFVLRHRGRLLRAFADHQDAGRLEIYTCGATHGFLPLLSTDEGRNAQIAVACDNYRRHFGRSPRGIWLPECAFSPGLDSLLADHGLRAFFVEHHGLTLAEPRPHAGSARPVYTPAGLAAFARDPACSQQVWSSESGYPGHPEYREFYRDLGWDLPYEEVAPLLDGTGNRRNLGLKLHRITGKVGLDKKEPWSPGRARAQAVADARDFLRRRIEQVGSLRAELGLAPHLVAPYDAELFGHWWFEGPWFLDAFFRAAATQRQVTVVAPLAYLEAEPVQQQATPALSSWGAEGYFQVWLNPGNDWIYKHLHRAEERMRALVQRFGARGGTVREVLAQAGRELLLAQASDWAFIITMGTTVPYAEKRTRDHVARFTRIHDGLLSGDLDPDWVLDVMSRDTCFPELDPLHWHPDRCRSRPGGAVASATDEAEAGM
jgi:1,4-alpha-glucan branching enzyme